MKMTKLELLISRLKECLCFGLHNKQHSYYRCGIDSVEIICGKCKMHYRKDITEQYTILE